MTDKSNQHRPLGVKSSLASVAVFLKKSTLTGKHCYSILDINITMLFEKSIQRISFYIHTIEKSVHISAKVTRKSERGGVLALQPDDTSGSYSMRGIDTTTAVYATLYDVSSHLTAVKNQFSARLVRSCLLFTNKTIFKNAS